MKRTRRIAIAAAGVITLVGGLCMQPGAASAAGATAATLNGQVTNSSGAVSGATVTFVAWPNPDTLDAIPINGDVPLVTLGSTATNSTGNWTYSPNLSSLGASYIGDDGSVDLQTEVVSGLNEQDYTTSVASTDTDDDNVATPTNPETLDSNLTSQTVTDTMDGDTDTTTDMVSAGTSAATARPNAGFKPDPSPPPPPHCGAMKHTSSYNEEPEQFLDLGTDNGVTAKVTETIESSHELGVGSDISDNGWGASGKTSVTASKASEAIVDYSASHSLDNEVNYHVYTQTCDYGPKGGTSHYTHPTSFYALQVPALSKSIETPLYQYCTTYNKGTFIKTVGHGHSFSAGVKLPFLSLSAQAAYSRHTETAWTFHGNNRQLCGSSDKGWASANEASAYLSTNGGNCQPGKPCFTPVKHS